MSDSYRKCLMNAALAGKEEAGFYYRMAVMLKPECKEGYLGLLNTLCKTPEDHEKAGIILQEALQAVEYDRTVTNEESLRSRPEEYIPVAYQLGTILIGNHGKDLEKAGKKYLTHVAQADMDQIDLGEENNVKSEWKRRSRTLLKKEDFLRSA